MSTGLAGEFVLSQVVCLRCGMERNYFEGSLVCVGCGFGANYATHGVKDENIKSGNPKSELVFTDVYCARCLKSNNGGEQVQREIINNQLVCPVCKDAIPYPGASKQELKKEKLKEMFRDDEEKPKVIGKKK